MSIIILVELSHLEEARVPRCGKIDSEIYN